MHHCPQCATMPTAPCQRWHAGQVGSAHSAVHTGQAPVVLAGDATLRFFPYLQGFGGAGGAFEGILPNLFTGVQARESRLHRCASSPVLSCHGQRSAPRERRTLQLLTLWTPLGWWTAACSTPFRCVLLLLLLGSGCGCFMHGRSEDWCCKLRVSTTQVEEAICWLAGAPGWARFLCFT